MKATLHGILTVAFLAALVISSASAQDVKPTWKFGPTPADSMECLKNQSLYAGYYDQKNFDMAVTFWRQNYNYCPASSDNIYRRGQVMFQTFYDKTKDKAYLDTLFMILDKRSEYFGEKHTWDFRKAFFMQQYSQQFPELMLESYKILGSYIKDNPAMVDNQVLVAQMNNSVNLYATKRIKQEDVVNDYATIIDIFDRLSAANPSMNGLQGSKDMAEYLFRQSGLATCQNLIPLFTPQVREKPEDVMLLKKVISLLVNAGCTDSDLYMESVKNLYQLEKSAVAAYNLATMSVARKNIAEGEKYYLEAVELEADPMNKSQYLTALATIELSNSDNIKARDYAKQAIQYNPNNGTAHLIIGSAYASTKISDDDFESRTVYWIAVDYFVKAKTLDPQLADKANESIESCQANFPKKDDAFFIGIYEEGVPYTVKGWINERTTVRFRK
ncbi:MAG: hypothetical protein FJY11_01490 [Bacteroidetes bacterium]|nr:hypothetical protein [Bacteroidota bacterium]